MELYQPWKAPPSSHPDDVASLLPHYCQEYPLPFEAATTFTCFNRLPAELRIKCWREALSTRARTLHLRQKTVKYARTSRRGRQPRAAHYCVIDEGNPLEVSALLQVCHESRREVLRQYKALLMPKTPSTPLSPLLYFNSSQDGVFVDTIWPWQKTADRPTGVFDTKQLSIHCNAWWSAWNRDSSKKILLGHEGLLSFRNLERLVIVFRILTEEEKARMFSAGARQSSKSSIWPNDTPFFLDFPAWDLHIQVQPILKAFRAMKQVDSAWRIPEVKLMAWGAVPI